MTAEPIPAPCHKGEEAVHHGGPRPVTRWIAIHAEEGGTARGAASWFANPLSHGSAHLSVDNKECWRSLPDEVIAYHAPPLNEEAWAVELAGWTAWKSATWFLHRRELNRAAYKVARRCKKYGIPGHFLTDANLKAGHPGLVTHAQITRIWHRSTHTDPGLGFPARHFARRVRFYLAQL